MAFDYSKLLGKMKEAGITQQQLAKSIGSTETTLSLKFNNKAKFKQAEISAICDVVGIKHDEIGEYFFTPKV